MRHFVQYHNTEEMGQECDTGETAPFEIVTNKRVNHLRGNTVWLVAGKGRHPRRYYLCQHFVVDEVGRKDEARFKFYARGRHGKRFQPLLPIDHYPWFHDFRASQQNFSLGVREIAPRYVAEFEKLAQQAEA